MPEDEVAQEETVDINDPKLAGGTDDDEDVAVEGEDISGAKSADFSDWVEPAKDVVFEITHASLKTYTPDGKDEWKNRSLKLYLKVDKAGVDGKGRYAGKVFFPNSRGNIGGLLVTVNRSAYDFTKNAQGKPTEWYAVGTGGAFADYNDFLQGLGFPTSPTPKNDKEFRASLIGRKIVADITKRARQAKDDTNGKYVDVAGEFENEISKYRPVKLAVEPESTEAAAA